MPHDNLKPHAEARLAMALWDHEYAYEQSGGTMDFWMGLSSERKRLVVNILDGVLKSLDENGRALQNEEGERKP